MVNSNKMNKFKFATRKSNNHSENKYLIRDILISMSPNLFLLWLLLKMIKWIFCSFVIWSAITMRSFPCLLRSRDALSIFPLNLWISRFLWCLLWKLLIVIWESVVHTWICKIYHIVILILTLMQQSYWRQIFNQNGLVSFW